MDFRTRHAGAMLNAASAQRRTYTIRGLPASTTFQLCFWNRTGNGLNTFDDRARSDNSGVVTIAAPLHSMFVLTTRRIS